MKKIILVLLFGISISGIMLAAYPKPVGGELYQPDFKNGFNVYIEERYSSLSTDSYLEYTTLPHSVWRISDEELKDQIFQLCGEIESYREYQKASDSMLAGSNDFEYLPQIYLDAGSFCYSIEILNWDNYAEHPWASWPIRQEMLNKPVVHIFRIDLSLKPESDDPLSYAMHYWGADSLNREGGAGWYSTLSQADLDELLALADSISAVNAEEVSQAG